MTTIRHDVPAGTTTVGAALARVTDVRLLSRPGSYELTPPVQSLCRVSEAQARADLEDRRPSGMPFAYAQTADGRLLLAPRFDRTISIEVEGD